MATIQPKGERVRQAIRWISSERQVDENKSIIPLIEEAVFRFNLSPKEEEFMRSFFQDGKDK